MVECQHLFSSHECYKAMITNNTYFFTFLQEKSSKKAKKEKKQKKQKKSKTWADCYFVN